MDQLDDGMTPEGPGEAKTAGRTKRRKRAAVPEAKPGEAAAVESVSRAAPSIGTVIEGHAVPPEPERMAMRLSAVGRLETGELSVAGGAIGAARADQVTVDRGAVGATMASEVRISRGYARSILARQVQLDRAAARVIIAADVTADQSAAMFLVARRVDGNLRVLFDWRGALAFGAAAGLVFALLSRLRRRGG